MMGPMWGRTGSVALAASLTVAAWTSAPPATADVSVAHAVAVRTAAADSHPAGLLWEGPVEVLSLRQGIHPGGSGMRFEHVGDELWVLGWQGNGSAVARSLDGGASWAEIAIAAPQAGERLTIDHVVPDPSGGYLAVAGRRTRCSGGDGVIAVCERVRPVLYTSADGHEWAEATPGAWEPPAGSSLRIDSIITVNGWVLAAGTVLGPDWRAVLYASPDGVNWTAERELTNAGNPLTAAQLVHDGETLTFIAHETACETPFDGEGGWALGAFWARHGRIFTGTDIASLTLLGPGEHPLAPEPLAVPDGCSFDGVPYAAVPYPQFRARLIGGVTTVFEDFVPPEQLELVEAADDDVAAAVRAAAGTRRYAQLADGAWALTELDDVSVPETVWFFEHAGAPAFADVVTAAPAVQQVFSVIEGVQQQSVSHPLVASVEALTAVGDELLLLGTEVADPFASSDRSTPTAVVVWRSAAGQGVAEPPCELAAGGVCRFSDLTGHPDYPDFAGRDLAGVDLAATNVGAANFDGSDLAGARLWLVDGDQPSFVGADLTGAQLQRARLGDISAAQVDGANFGAATIASARGVDFSDSGMASVRLNDITETTFGDADLTRATLVVADADSFPDLAMLTYERINVNVRPPDGETVELDLTGVDLTGLRLAGPFVSGGEAPRLVITSLTGAVIENTTFSDLDLSRVDPQLDLSELEVVTGSTICPVGARPDGGYFGVCIRDD